MFEKRPEVFTLGSCEYSKFDSKTNIENIRNSIRILLEIRTFSNISLKLNSTATPARYGTPLLRPPEKYNYEALHDKHDAQLYPALPHPLECLASDFLKHHMRPLHATNFNNYDS